MSSIPESYSEVRSKVATACDLASRPVDSVELVVVSKTWPADTLREVIDCGHRTFGENRLQEVEVKAPALPTSLNWHFIGQLQKNKVRKVLNHCDTIHSVDSLALAERIDSIAGELGVFPKIYLQVNAAEEASKAGFTPEQLEAELDTLLNLKRIEILGLMAIPPSRKDPEEARPDFRTLRELRDRLESTTGVPLPGLSMGMSHDYEIAIAEGSTTVRVGSSIFGKRRAWQSKSATD